MPEITANPNLDFSFPLFVPATRPERITKAWAAGTDAIIIDLEDAVAETDKDAARTGLGLFLKEQAAIPRATEKGQPVATYLRINGTETRWYREDLELFNALNLDGIVLPKAETAEALQTLRSGLSAEKNILALIETARGIGNVRTIAGECDRLVFGSIDYCADMGCAHTQTTLLHARAEIVLASRIAGLRGPLDGVTTATSDETLIQADAAHSAALGFAGKLLIHPAQIAPARRGFAPSAEEIDWAQRVIDASQQGGAVAVDGAMVDAPVIAQADNILRRQQVLA